MKKILEKKSRKKILEKKIPRKIQGELYFILYSIQTHITA